MRIPLAALTLFAILAQKPTGRTVTLDLPHELREGEAVWLMVTVGAIPGGAEIAITTPTGRPLGVISPYAIRRGQEAGTYTIPLPAAAISGRQVRLRLSLEHNGKQRAPTKKEVKKVEVKIGAAEWRLRHR